MEGRHVFSIVAIQPRDALYLIAYYTVPLYRTLARMYRESKYLNLII